MHTGFINNVFAGKAAEAFCLMLIHSLWQGLLFTIITGLVLMFTKKSRAALRYNIMSVLFGLFIVICAGTFIWELNSTAQQAIEQQKVSAGILAASSVQLFLKSFGDYFSANASLITMIWFLVFLAKCVKMMGSLVYCQRVKHHKTQQPPAYWKNKITSLCEQLQVKRTVLLLESKIIKIPVVIGHLKPIIFIPVGLLANLPAGEVEAVLLHELAHIRRNDYFMNFIQVIAENIFFFNPALLWMSSLLRDERENCCDDVAVAQTKSKKQFIKALISFKEYAVYPTSYTTAFATKKGQLLQRVTRLIHNKNKTLNAAERAFFFISLFLLVILSLAAATAGSLSATKKLTKKEAPAVIQQPAINEPLTGNGNVTADNIKRYVVNEKPISGRNKAITNYNLDAIAAAKHKPLVIELYNKIITDDNSEPAETDQGDQKKPAHVITDQEQVEQDRQMAERDRQQAIKDQAQAAEDYKQAELDRMQAQKDREQALQDMRRAEADRLQALESQQMHEKEKIINIK